MTKHTNITIRDLLESGAEKTLRRLERAAKSARNPAASSVKRYIQAVARIMGNEEAFKVLVNDYHVLPGPYIDIIFVPEQTPFEGNAGNARAEQWVRDELNQGNMLAWCVAHLHISWFGHEGDDYLGAVSVSNRREGLELVEGHDMLGQAIKDLVTQLPGDLVPDYADPRNPSYYVNEYLRGKEGEDWVSY